MLDDQDARSQIAWKKNDPSLKDMIKNIQKDPGLARAFNPT
jgi:hypothetical protein